MLKLHTIRLERKVNMKYSEKVVHNLNKMVELGELPKVETRNNFVTVKYDRVYNAEKKGKISTEFCYKISEEAKSLFSNANKTHVVINHETPIDYNYFHKEYIPREIVAITCGFKDYKQLKEMEDSFPEDEKDRIEFMFSGLIPISKEEYSMI